MDQFTLGEEVPSEPAWGLFRPVCTAGERRAVIELLQQPLDACSMPHHEQHTEHTATWSKHRVDFTAHAGAGPGAAHSPGDMWQGGTMKFSLG